MSTILVDGFDDVGDVPGVGTEEGVHRYLIVQIDHWCAWPGRKALSDRLVEGWLDKCVIGGLVESICEVIEAMNLTLVWI